MKSTAFTVFLSGSRKTLSTEGEFLRAAVFNKLSAELKGSGVELELLILGVEDVELDGKRRRFLESAAAASKRTRFISIISDGYEPLPCGEGEVAVDTAQLELVYAIFPTARSAEPRVPRENCFLLIRSDAETNTQEKQTIELARSVWGERLEERVIRYDEDEMQALAKTLYRRLLESIKAELELCPAFKGCQCSVDKAARGSCMDGYPATLMLRVVLDNTGKWNRVTDTLELYDVGEFFRITECFGPAMDWYMEAQRVYRNSELHGSTRMYMTSCIRIATYLSACARARESEEWVALAEQTARKKYLEKLDSQDAMCDLAAACSSMGNFYMDTTQAEKAGTWFEEAERHRKRLLAIQPDNESYLWEYSVACFQLGRYCNTVKMQGTAEKWFTATVDIRTQLADMFPENVFYQLAYGSACTIVANYYRGRAVVDDTEEWYNKAATIYRTMAEEHPDSAACCAAYGDIAQRLADFYKRRGVMSSATRWLAIAGRMKSAN